MQRLRQAGGDRAEARDQRLSFLISGKATTKGEKAIFTTKVTKSTKLRSLEISMSETFVAFVCFVVR